MDFCDNHQVQQIKLREFKMQMPDGCQHCAEGEICPNITDEFSTKIEPTLRDFDIYVLATPTWSDNVTPLALIFWNRIVSWCHEDRLYLKNKKIGLITHGMADQKSWQTAVNWLKGVCAWEKAIFAGSLTCKSGANVGEVELTQQRIADFINGLIDN